MIDPAARARLEQWKWSLLDLSAANRLLDLAGDAMAVALPSVDPLGSAAALAEGGGLVVGAAPELVRQLTALRRAARAELAGGGAHALWLGLGLLTWCEPAPDATTAAETVAYTAPLALWPVVLERHAGGFRLVAAAGVEPVCNPVLVEKLRRDARVVLPGERDELDLAALLDAADAIAASRPGWRLDRSAVLGVFSFARFAMWSDLEARGDELGQGAVLAHIARGAGVGFGQPSRAAAGAVTGCAPLTDLLAPLDADAGQLAAVAAAGAGASFVLQGPPGTGKSQTIANLIAHCIAHGKTVLFVSHKAAALDAVQQRLAAVGLGEFCLELHSHKAVRARVVAQLARVLERAFRPVSGQAGSDARLGALRAELDAHVVALHRVGPFGRSVHDVLARLVELRGGAIRALADRDASGLDRQAFDRRRVAIAELAAAAIPVEPVATHPWRASAMARWPSDGKQRATEALDEAAAATAALDQAVRGVASLVPGLVARTREQLQALGALAALAAASPRPGAELLTQLRTGRADDIAETIALIRARGAGAIEPPRDPPSFLALATRHRQLATEVNDRFTDSVAELDVPALWQQLRRWAHRLAPLRFAALRHARAAIRAAAMPGMLETDGAMITALESVIAEGAARTALLAAAEPARRWFGELGGNPLELDLKKLEAAVAWASELRLAFDAVAVANRDAGRAAAWRALVAQVAANPATEAAGGELAAFVRLAEAVVRWRRALSALAEATGIDAAVLGAGDDHLAALATQVAALRDAIEGMQDWVAFHNARRAALTAGLGPAVTAIECGELAAAELAAGWERATLLAWLDGALSDSAPLARFHGAAHHAHAAEFADVDRAALVLVRARALSRLAERVPRATADHGGELATLLHEIKSPRAHRPLRRLLRDIPTLLPRLAPCLVMSPSAVALHLDPAVPRFDVVVFDEASQLTTAEALPALARGDAVVVVGDSRQLPAMRDSSPSLLEDCLAARLPALSLGSHYRSKHEDLIAFANQRYYANQLTVFPAAQASPDLGVAWRRVDGVYDPAARHNRAEAEAVVAELLARLRDPARRTRSIAVVALSRAQRAQIEDLVDAARADRPELDELFEVGPPGAADREPALIGDVESVQGDARDVVLLSIGYARDADGAFPTDLGPLSRPGGERWLNVATTRAREQLVVFSSFVPEELGPSTDQGVHDLGALVAFASSSRSAEDAAPASPITAAVARALVERGWTVRHQVGCGAYKIDLAVVDPVTERYILAIELDGAAYASASAARDRDRLRAQVLGQLGWRMHRIWALDWWADPEREAQRAHAAIVTAVAANRQRRVPATDASPPRRPAQPRSGDSGPARKAPRAADAPAQVPLPLGPRAVHESGREVAPVAAGSGPTDAVAALLADTSAPIASGSAPIRLARNAIAIGPYRAAAIPAGRRAPDDLFAPRHLGELGKIIEQVLAAEAPMHIHVLARRVGAYFGIGRLTPRVTDQVRVALAGLGRWGDEDDIVWRFDQDPAGVPSVRVAGTSASARREIDEVPLCEVAAAARIVVERAATVTAADLVRDAARLLGFARTTDRVVERVASGVRLAVQRDLIRLAGGTATLPD